MILKREGKGYKLLPLFLHPRFSLLHPHSTTTKVNRKGSVKREIDTKQNNGPNVPSSESSSSSSREDERKKRRRKWDKSTEKVVAKSGGVRRGSNNNLMRMMPQIFTDSEGYITLPPPYPLVGDQCKNGMEINSGMNGNAWTGTKEHSNQDSLYNQLKSNKTVAFDLNGERKKKKSWKKCLFSLLFLMKTPGVTFYLYSSE